MDRELYLPREWADDWERRAAAKEKVGLDQYEVRSWHGWIDISHWRW